MRLMLRCRKPLVGAAFAGFAAALQQGVSVRGRRARTGLQQPQRDRLEHRMRAITAIEFDQEFGDVVFDRAFG